MAFIEATRDPQVVPTPADLLDADFQLPRWVNVSIKVGENVRNFRITDTLWTQFVIKKIFDSPSMNGLTRPSKPLAVDGIYGDTTKTWIAHFQSHNQTETASSHPDGQVSRVPPGAFSTRRKFTAYQLNKVLAAANPLLYFNLTNSAISNAKLESFIKNNL